MTECNDFISFYTWKIHCPFMVNVTNRNAATLGFYPPTCGLGISLSSSIQHVSMLHLSYLNFAASFAFEVWLACAASSPSLVFGVACAHCSFSALFSYFFGLSFCHFGHFISFFRVVGLFFLFCFRGLLLVRMVVLSLRSLCAVGVGVLWVLGLLF